MAKKVVKLNLIEDESKRNTSLEKKKKLEEKKNAKLTPEEKSLIQEVLDSLDSEITNIEKMDLRTIRKNNITNGEVRDLVKLYYQIQDIRIGTSNRVYAEVKIGVLEKIITKPFLLAYVKHQLFKFEETIAKFLKVYAESHPVGRWLLSITGIGPVIAAGMLAYIDIERCQSAGSIWHLAGYTGVREIDKRMRGQKAQHNPEFKVLCWKAGDSFVKQASREKDVYGKIYKAQKDWYIEKNELGAFAEVASWNIVNKNFKKSSDDNSDNVAYGAYSMGKLPNAHIDAMARRYAVKIFLSHLFEVWYEHHHGVKIPAPYEVRILGHKHIFHPPNQNILFPDKKLDESFNLEMYLNHIRTKGYITEDMTPFIFTFENGDKMYPKIDNNADVEGIAEIFARNNGTTIKSIEKDNVPHHIVTLVKKEKKKGKEDKVTKVYRAIRVRAFEDIDNAAETVSMNEGLPILEVKRDVLRRRMIVMARRGDLQKGE